MLEAVELQTELEWAEHAREVLQRAGHHRGAARERLIELFAWEGCALSAQQIEDALRKGDEPPVGRASIYRALELLSDQQLITRLDVGDGVARYERAEPDGEHHHHLVCDHCGRLVAFDDPGLEREIDRVSERLGMRINQHDVLLRGACPDCGD
jgi:Fur family transcriptional regulator, ferric uptake regulator